MSDQTGSLSGTDPKMLDQEETRHLVVDFSEMAKESRERFEGYWIVCFWDLDAEEEKALNPLERLWTVIPGWWASSALTLLNSGFFR